VGLETHGPNGGVTPAIGSIPATSVLYLTQDCHLGPDVHTRRMRRDDICLYLGPADRAELQVLLSNRNTSRTLVWRAEIVLATAGGHLRGCNP